MPLCFAQTAGRKPAAYNCQPHCEPRSVGRRASPIWAASGKRRARMVAIIDGASVSSGNASPAGSSSPPGPPSETLTLWITQPSMYMAKRL
eukprot:CAMPEP_0115878208 /NCGR_PEP_ID=MMETSP0287-20121206/26649_1 /TAXON_ID=412157 /ORGANISM="Chrysochromulina rotalis, Strain UIO044" /LENGTH=90 /DNA_ID=CAMNT_0003333805 /DNA_START=392 /DNA_END=661 /DNA_ORIENTATION=-